MHRATLSLLLAAIPACFAPKVTPLLDTGSTTDEATTGASGTSSAAPTTGSQAASTSGLENTTSPDPDTEGSPTCGNGLLEEGEACDDGNDVNADGCNVDCVESGAEIWTATFHNGAEDRGADLAISGAGQLLILADTTVGGNWYSNFVRIYDSDGNTVSTLPSTQDLTTIAFADDDSYFGISRIPSPNDDSENLRGYHRYRAGRYSLQGDTMWEYDFEEWGSIGRIVRQGAGFIVAGGWSTGFSAGENSFDPNGFTYSPRYRFSAFSDTGNVLWYLLGPPEEFGLGRCHSIAVDIDGGVTAQCAGSNISTFWKVERFANDGAHLSTYEPGGSTIGVAQDHAPPTMGAALDSEGSFLAFEPPQQGGVNASTWHLVKIDDQSALVWREPLLGTTGLRPVDVEVDSQDNIVVVGWQDSESGSNGTDSFVRKYSASGQLLWQREQNGPGNGDDEIVAAVLDEQDNIIVLGKQSTSEIDSDVWLRKYAP